MSYVQNTDVAQVYKQGPSPLLCVPFAYRGQEGQHSHILLIGVDRVVLSGVTEAIH